ncbi:small subunit rRNA maturation protein LCP5 Ecym_8397 [Eremothecium cymbalariae DBVPG|uniref:Uncharacterized protein n=1 Tax=Eremothecium cymbalariae (strain CBS 270.75 / DBVPG 7215 / KCTC 17166 / NRRL Y-17582) TaxID=931890 RepID=G8JXU3_ERECY|nr:Hypothetical protein Ecym_8397 [Eremothecium cymbalariae DBVPG\
MSELTQVLKQINESLANTSEALSKLKEFYHAEDSPSGVIETILNKNWSSTGLEKVSLLSLKNGSMLAYLDSLMGIVGEKLQKTDECTSERSRKRSLEHRVCLERGVKPLEKKLGYQLDKLTRAYIKMEKEYDNSKQRARERGESAVGAAEGAGSDVSDSSDDEEALMYKPNTNAMVSKNTGKNSRDKKAPQDVDGGEESNSGVYKPPKISAMLPPAQNHHFEDKFNAQEHKNRSSKSRMQAMEEFIKENTDQPELETSIGANIVKHGKGGIKSLRDADRESSIKQYEEDNFTRLNAVGNKAEKRKSKQKEIMARVNMIGGEDFSIFNSKRKLEDSTSRKGNKKPRTSWDRAKKRM